MSSIDSCSEFYEGVIVHFDHTLTSLRVIVGIDLLTHSSSANHSMRHKYRSAIYTCDEEQQHEILGLMQLIQEQSRELL